MPEVYYSRTEIKTILDDAVIAEWMRSSENEPSETIDRFVRLLKDQFGIVEEQPRRLILSLTYYPDAEKAYPLRVVERAHTLRMAFAKRFPNAPKFSETTQVFTQSSDWKYIFSGATDEHIQWAKAAKDCGLIDAYIVDYDPSWKGD
jgi:hypothetical protein